MSPEENKALVSRFNEEVFGKRNLAAIDEFITPDQVDHSRGRRQSSHQVHDYWYTARSVWPYPPYEEAGSGLRNGDYSHRRRQDCGTMGTR